MTYLEIWRLLKRLKTAYRKNFQKKLFDLKVQQLNF